MTAPALLEVRDLEVTFAVRRGLFGGVQRSVHAVRGVSLDMARGETLALVGESGCGKTTLARAIVRLVEPTAGRVVFDGIDLGGLGRAALRAMRRHVQMVFQDPMGSLNPRMTVRRIVGDPLLAHGLATRADVADRVTAVLERVGLEAAHRDRYPFEFSGGQRQRIGIARAIALEPALIVCDEAVSALDVSVQAQILNLLRALRQDLGLAYLFVSHDLNVVRHVADRIAVMYLGSIVETGPAAAIMAAAAHPYTRSLIAANPVPDPDAPYQDQVLGGDVPSPLNPPAGCAFHTRCPDAMAICAERAPVATVPGPGRTVSCHLYAGAVAPAAMADDPGPHT